MKEYETSDKYYYKLLQQHAKEHRKNPTEAERVLWMYLRADQLGVRFKRQYVVNCFIADFICLPCKLIIEIDGGYHNLSDQQFSDQQRSDQLNALGFYVLRFKNEQVLHHTEYVIERIKETVNHIKND